MEKSLLKKQVRLLQILAQGCKRHPAYSAIRPATRRCAPCVRMWGARLELRKLQSWISMGIVFVEKLAFRWGLKPIGLAIVIAKTAVETALRLSLPFLVFHLKTSLGASKAARKNQNFFRPHQVLNGFSATNAAPQWHSKLSIIRERLRLMPQP